MPPPPLGAPPPPGKDGKPADVVVHEGDHARSGRRHRRRLLRAADARRLLEPLPPEAVGRIEIGRRHPGGMRNAAVHRLHRLLDQLRELGRQFLTGELAEAGVVAAADRVRAILVVAPDREALLDGLRVAVEPAGVGVDPVLDELVPMPVGAVRATDDCVDGRVADHIRADMAGVPEAVALQVGITLRQVPHRRAELARLAVVEEVDPVPVRLGRPLLDLGIEGVEEVDILRHDDGDRVQRRRARKIRRRLQLREETLKQRLVDGGDRVLDVVHDRLDVVLVELPDRLECVVDREDEVDELVERSAVLLQGEEEVVRAHAAECRVRVTPGRESVGVLGPSIGLSKGRPKTLFDDEVDDRTRHGRPFSWQSRNHAATRWHGQSASATPGDRGPRPQQQVETSQHGLSVAVRDRR